MSKIRDSRDSRAVSLARAAWAWLGVIPGKVTPCVDSWQIARCGEQLGIAAELMQFLWEAKLWWMLPMVFIPLLIGGLIIFAQSSAIAPFIYTLF